MAERDGSARRKKKTKRQTIRVPVDEVPRRAGTGSAPPVAEESLAEAPAEDALTPVPEQSEAPSQPTSPGRHSQRTVVDMELPAGMLEMFDEPTRDSSDPDTGEVSVEVDVSDAERPSVPPPAPDATVAAMLAATDPADRPTPPPKESPWLGSVDPGDRPTPPPMAPSEAVLLSPVAPVAVVVMAPIRSVGTAVIEPPAPEPEPVPPAVPEAPLLPAPKRATTKQGVAPVVPPLVDSLDWAGSEGHVPFEGDVPGELAGATPPSARAPARADVEPPALGRGQEPEVGEPEVEEPEAEEPEVEGPQVEEPREPEEEEPEEEEDIEQEDVGQDEVEQDEVERDPAADRGAAPPPPPAPPTLAETSAPVAEVVAGPVAAVAESAAEDVEPIDDRESDPGTPIDVEAEVIAPPAAAEPPSPPAVARIASGPKMVAVSPPPPPTPPGAATPVPAGAPKTGTPPPPVPLGALSPGGAAAPPVPPPVPADAARAEGAERRRKGKKWWDEFFNEEWLRTIPRVPVETTRKECDFIEASLAVERSAAILDLGCGIGRHAVELALRGYSVVALDVALPILERAQASAADNDAKVAFQQADMRDLSFDSSFDAVYCIGTTLGLFDEDGNLQVIRNAHRALRENGTLLIEVVNRDFVQQSHPNLVWFEGEGCVCMEETNMNYITSRLHVKRTVMPDEGGQTETEYSVRLFSLHELGSLLHRNGFRVLEVSGHWATRGVFFGAHSQRLIVLAEKRSLTEAGVPTTTQSGMAPLKASS